MKKNQIMKVSIILILIIAIMAGLYLAFAPKAVEGSKTINIDVIIEEEIVREEEISTDAEFLSQALYEVEGLIEGETSEYGLFIQSVNNVKADSTNEEWWCITKSGESVNTGADQTPILDGDSFELTLMVGY